MPRLSFILNQLAGKSSGFSVGGTVQAHTKGIWMWGAPLQLSAPGAPDNLLLLDTEGLQSLSATEGHDAKIFSLAILLASSFLYNSEKAINNAAIDQLSLVAQLTQRIRAKSGRGDEGAAALASEMPDFLWLLRDFQLELKDESGRPITKDEYLDEALRPQRGTSAAAAELNATRAAIKTLFPRRACETLPHPTLGTRLGADALKNLPALEKLAPPFRDGVHALKARVLATVRPKAVGGVALSGTALLRLAEAYVDAINKGAVPVISSAWQSVVQLEGRRALDDAIGQYRAAARAFAGRTPPPERDAWEAEHARLSQAAIAAFRAAALGGGGGGAATLEQQLVAAMADERKQLDALIGAQSTALCQKVAASVGDRLGRYAAASHASHAADLPAAIEAAIGEYAAGAAGAAKAEGLHALLTGRVLPLVRSTLAAAEEGARAATAKTAGLEAEVGRAGAPARRGRATAQSAAAGATLLWRRAAVADADAAVGARAAAEAEADGLRAQVASRDATIRSRDATIAAQVTLAPIGASPLSRPPAALSGGARRRRCRRRRRPRPSSALASRRRRPSTLAAATTRPRSPTCRRRRRSRRPAAAAAR